MRPLKEEFPRLFLLSAQQEKVVRNMWMEGDNGGWNLLFGRRLIYVRETQVLEILLERIQGVSLNPISPDVLKWRWLGDKIFSVRSEYMQWDEQYQEKNCLLGALLRNLCPAKVEIFAWLAFQDRVATRLVPLQRKLVVENSLCPLCNIYEETPTHLLLHCQFAWDV